MKGILALGLALAAASSGAQGYQLQLGTTFQNFQDVSSWHSYDGKLSVDSADTRSGLPSMMLSNSPGSGAHASKAISADMSTVGTISMWVYAQYPVNDNGWHACSLYFSSDGFKDSFVAVSQKLRPGWSRLSFSKTDFQARGNPSWNTPMTGVQVGTFTDTKDAWSVSFADMEMNSYYRPQLIIAFDDNYESSYLYGYNYLKQYGIAGTEFVISGRVGWSDYTSVAELNEMYNYGWDMCNHTTTHPDLRTLSQSQIVQEYDTCKQFLIAHGWTRNQGYLHLAYPQGHFNGTVLSADQQEGLITARTTMETVGSDLTESPYLLYAMVPDSTTQTVSDILASVDQVVADGGALQITFHDLVNTPASPIQWRIADFDMIVDHVAALRAAGKLDVVTLTQWYAGINKSAANTQSMTLPPSIVGGNTASGVVAVQPAPQLSETVSLSTGAPFVTVPPTIQLPAGQTSATFTISTRPVTYATVVTVAASVGGYSFSSVLTVLPATPAQVSAGASTVPAGSSTTGYVMLTGPAPAGGLMVSLLTGNSIVTVPSAVVVPGGVTQASFSISVGQVASPLAVRIQATANGASVSGIITAVP